MTVFKGNLDITPVFSKTAERNEGTHQSGAEESEVARVHVAQKVGAAEALEVVAVIVRQRLQKHRFQQLRRVFGFEWCGFM